MNTNLLKPYTKSLFLLLFFTLNISINFTPEGMKIDVKHTDAQRPEGDWDTGSEWLDEFLEDTGGQEGTYFNTGDGNWSYCPSCAFHVNVSEVTVYGTDLSNWTNYGPDINASYGLSTDIFNYQPTGSYWQGWSYISNSWLKLNNVATIPTITFDELQLTTSAEDAVAYVNQLYDYDQAACNIGVRHAFEQLTCNDAMYGMLANTMVQYWENSNDWELIGISEAQSEANNGYMVVAGTYNSSGSGHVVVIVPGNEIFSSSWGDFVPVGMDTGPNKKWTKKGINYSWSSSQKNDIKFYKYTGTTYCF